MITIISGTNRPGNKTIKIAEFYLQYLKEKGVDVQLFDLQTLPPDFVQTWVSDKQSPDFQKQVETYFRDASKFLLVIPEYQGTFPGVLKLVFDAVPPRYLKGKKAGMVGLGAGRGGNLRGMDHLSGAFHYLGIHVFPFHLPISKINDLTTPDGTLHDETTIKSLQLHADAFVDY